MWPEKPADEAGRLLSDCLNPDRAAKLCPEKLVLLLKIARAKGCHLAAHWLCDEVGYSRPAPVEPTDQMAALQREYIEATKAVVAIAHRIERVNLKAVS